MRRPRRLPRGGDQGEGRLTLRRGRTGRLAGLAWGMDGVVVRTERLLLRAWRESDREPFAAINADPQVRRYFPNRLSHEESDALVERYEAEREQVGFCPWALERREDGALAGSVGLSRVAEVLPAAPAVQLGWRLASAYWGRGYATEAARACMEYGFVTLDLEEIVAVTATRNQPSRRVMERLGMTRSATDDFEHPSIAAGHPLRAHVLYRKRRD